MNSSKILVILAHALRRLGIVCRDNGHWNGSHNDG
jgi:hypothetical protein